MAGLAHLGVLEFIEAFEKEQIGNLLNDFQRIRDATRPQRVPDAVNLAPNLACKHRLSRGEEPEIANQFVQNVRMPAEKRGKRRTKPYLTPQQVDELMQLIPEPYATMVYVAVYTGLRVSELVGLKWGDIHEDAVTIDERYCRGDWGAPKSECSNATIGVNPLVITRIHRLRRLTVNVRAGRAVRKYRIVRSEEPDDLVFQSVRTGQPMRDGNILRRFIKPAARSIGLGWVNWRSLRTSHAVWLKMAGADVKDAQGQMRHAQASTTLNIYQQFVPETQRQVVNKLRRLSKAVH